MTSVVILNFILRPSHINKFIWGVVTQIFMKEVCPMDVYTDIHFEELAIITLDLWTKMSIIGRYQLIYLVSDFDFIMSMLHIYSNDFQS